MLSLQETLRLFSNDLWNKIQSFFLLKQEAYDGILVEQSWKTVACVQGNTEITLPSLENVEEISVEMYHSDGTIVHQVNLRVDNLLYESTNTTHREILLDSIHNSQTYVTYNIETNTITPSYCEGEEVSDVITTTVRIKETLQTGTTNLVASRIKYDNEVSGMNADNMQSAIDELSRTLGYTVTSKNYLPNNKSTHTYMGVTFTVNKDKSVTVNGTGGVSNWTPLNLVGGFPYNDFGEINGLIEDKEYILSGCPSGGGDDGYQLFIGIYDENGTHITMYRDSGEGVKFTHRKGYQYHVFIGVKLNATVDNVTFYPMISEEGGEYEPYVADVQTHIDNHNITSREKLLEQNYSASISTQTINIPNYHAHNMLSIRIQGDANNGIRLNIPKVLYDSPTPFYIDAKNKNDSGYTFKAQGSFANGSLIINYSTITGWAKFNVLVLGIK